MEERDAANGPSVDVLGHTEIEGSGRHLHGVRWEVKGAALSQNRGRPEHQETGDEDQCADLSERAVVSKHRGMPSSPFGWRRDGFRRRDPVHGPYQRMWGCERLEKSGLSPGPRAASSPILVSEPTHSRPIAGPSSPLPMPAARTGPVTGAQGMEPRPSQVPPVTLAAQPVLVYPRARHPQERKRLVDERRLTPRHPPSARARRRRGTLGTIGSPRLPRGSGQGVRTEGHGWAHQASRRARTSRARRPLCSR